MENNKNIRIIKFVQNNNVFISTVMSFSLIDKLSEVIEYGKHPDGYQRSPNRIHYMKVKSYISSNPNDFKFPSAIILGADELDLTTKYTKKDSCGEYLNLDIKEQKKIFRIVDGQHRIAGIREALKVQSSLNSLMLPVIIILSKKGKKSTELEIFTEINSKAKRISTDLAELAKHNYQIKEKTVNEKNVISHISIKTAYKLKTKGNNSVWNQGVKFDIHSEIVFGIVGVTMFSESIKNIVEGYVDKQKVSRLIEKNRKDEIIEYCDELADIIADKLDHVWNDVVKSKWPQCFIRSTVKNEDGELFDIYYTKDYYIQNTLGIKAINNILGDLIKLKGTGQNTFNEFKTIITGSKVTFKDWAKGGTFSGLSSESGFGKVRKYIKNEITASKN